MPTMCRRFRVHFCKVEKKIPVDLIEIVHNELNGLMHIWILSFDARPTPFRWVINWRYMRMLRFASELQRSGVQFKQSV